MSVGRRLRHCLVGSECVRQQIGRDSLAVAGVDNPEKLLLYCEVEEGRMSSDLFFRTEADGSVFHILGPDELDDVILKFWDTWKVTPGNHEWRVMSYVIDNGKFKDLDDAASDVAVFDDFWS